MLNPDQSQLPTPANVTPSRTQGLEFQYSDTGIRILELQGPPSLVAGSTVLPVNLPRTGNLLLTHNPNFPTCLYPRILATHVKSRIHRMSFRVA
jgi:hypothetical protein